MLLRHDERRPRRNPRIMVTMMMAYRKRTRVRFASASTRRVSVEERVSSMNRVGSVLSWDCRFSDLRESRVT